MERMLDAELAAHLGYDDKDATSDEASRTIQRDYDLEVYKLRDFVKNYFTKIKDFRGIAAKSDKTDCSYTACWNLVATHIA